uniref:Uncharacterized protein n=1 Tax=Panagrolaimus sp. ES5 TaxID=591445 RepID=A0AC34FSH9_9BILA
MKVVVIFALIIWSYLGEVGCKECRVNNSPYSPPPLPAETTRMSTTSTTPTTTTTVTTTTTPPITTTKATTKRPPPPPPKPCTRCGALPLVGAIAGYLTVNSVGTVTQGVNGAGCKTYAVTCHPFPAKWTAMGCNYQHITLAQTWSAPAHASLFCNGNGKIEGRVKGGGPIIVTSVYCATSLI